MKTLALSLFAAAALTVGVTTASAQSPDQQFGLGVQAGSVNGANVAYALSPSIHLGATVGLAVGDVPTTIMFAPYGKFILKGTKEFKPFVLGQFYVQRMSTQAVPGSPSVSSTNTGLAFHGGAEWFATPNLGIYGMVGVVDIPFYDGGQLAVGVLSPTIGVEWFF
ncbi:MAG: hypothetical protein MUC47_06850 [Candidatus Kapabacteria bacterium]|nr:hypothetical protein [Candidatus Kapabacteria bacterium]